MCRTCVTCKSPKICCAECEAEEPVMINKPFDPTKPVQTREGRKVRIICTDLIGEQPIVACIMMSNNQEFVGRFSKDGQYYSSGKSCYLDLVNIPQKRWVNLYKESELQVNAGYVYSTKDDADRVAAEHRIACVEIDWPE